MVDNKIVFVDKRIRLNDDLPPMVQNTIVRLEAHDNEEETFPLRVTDGANLLVDDAIENYQFHKEFSEGVWLNID